MQLPSASNEAANRSATDPPASVSDDSASARLNLFRESDRLRTFEKWPVDFIDRKKLAKAGFYYTNKGDSVTCPFCRIQVGRWDRGDDPLDEHTKHSPNCAYVVSWKASAQNYGDVDLENLPDELVAPYTSYGEDTCGPIELTPSVRNYAEFDQRLATYCHWPENSRPSPVVLSEAGFFHKGAGDQTECFECGNVLSNWEPTDDPWVEHAVWFPQCRYVLSKKGQEFVNTAHKKKHQNLVRAQEEILANLNRFLLEDENGVNSKQKAGDSSEPASSSESASNTSERMMCQICYQAERNTIFYPCHHLGACYDCALKLTSCGFCREPITERIRIFVP